MRIRKRMRESERTSERESKRGRFIAAAKQNKRNYGVDEKKTQDSGRERLPVKNNTTKTQTSNQ